MPAHVGTHAGYTETFTILDFETTGLDHEKDQAIEIAAIKTDLTREYGRLQMTVSLNEEGAQLPEFITNLTGLTADDLKNGSSELAAYIALAAFIGNDTVVTHYCPFDLAFLSRYGIEPQYYLCTRSLARFLFPEESASLAPTCERLGIELEGAHRAMNDAEATAKLLPLLMEEAEKRGITRRQYQNMIVDSAERPNRFTPKYAKVINM